MNNLFSNIIPDDVNEYLEHYGTPQNSTGSMGSGRYRKGSGENPYQHESEWMNSANELKKKGLTDTEVARALNMSSTEYRSRRSIESDELRKAKIRTAVKLKEHGYSNVTVAKMMGTTESNIRNWTKQGMEDKTNRTISVANKLMSEVDKKGYLDVGEGVELEFSDNTVGGANARLGISKDRMKTALQVCKDKGYSVLTVKVPQPNNPDHATTVKVLAPPGTKAKDIYDVGLDSIQSLKSYSQDNGKTFYDIEYPTSVDSKRIYIRYGDEKGVSGSDLDGIIQLRRGVEDISLGDSSYAQVRIAVDNTHYMKGMAIYSNDIPKGYDIVYNTNKKTGTPPEKVFKPLKTDKDGNIDPDNPFGAALKAETGQRHYIDPKTGEDKLSCINKIREEGDWGTYSKTLASQMLSKQPTALIKNQLELSMNEKRAQYDEIMQLTNPVVKNKLLMEFASDCDASAVHLKAAALPRQTTKVLLPVPTMKDNEIYAPSYKNGENVALIRYPHGGTFEIPILKVNNKQPQAKDFIGNSLDAVGINSKVAEKLSGADFDGDTAVVIPCNNSGSKIRIASSPSLPGLKNFDPKSYKYPEADIEKIERLEKQGLKPPAIKKETGLSVLDSQSKGQEMGKITNLINDMTLKGASTDELTRAVRHSMVVIDAEKHKLDYKASERDNNIRQLKKDYQQHEDGNGYGGASTLISRAKSQYRVPERKEGGYFDIETGKPTDTYVRGKTKKLNFDPITGEKLYTYTGRTYISKTGKEVVPTKKSTKMAETNDARTLSSGTEVENIYANYANSLKSLANEARVASLSVGTWTRDKEAAKLYSSEVSSLNSKLNLALRNKPRERQAQLAAYEITKAKLKDNPHVSHEEKQKIATQALQGARSRLGASKPYIQITDKEWEAIQAHALSKTNLESILNNSKPETIKQLATPKQATTVSTANQTRMKSMSSAGYTIAEIADQLGVSTSTVSKYLK